MPLKAEGLGKGGIKKKQRGYRKLERVLARRGRNRHPISGREEKKRKIRLNKGLQGRKLGGREGSIKRTQKKKLGL